MRGLKILVGGLLTLSAFACGGSYRNDGGSGGAGFEMPSPTGKSGAGAGAANGTGASTGNGAEAKGDCVYEGAARAAYDVFPSACGKTTCQTDGKLVSEKGACMDCYHNGIGRRAGEVFADRDGCNQCTCQADGRVECSANACACQPDAEWWREYALRDAAACQGAVLSCPAYSTPFRNECGCGCQEEPLCPYHLGCFMDPNVDSCQPFDRCPFSLIKT